MPSRGAKPIWAPCMAGSASSRAQHSNTAVSMAWLSRKTNHLVLLHPWSYPTPERGPQTVGVSAQPEDLPLLAGSLPQEFLTTLCPQLIWQGLMKGPHVTAPCSQGMRGPPQGSGLQLRPLSLEPEILSAIQEGAHLQLWVRSPGVNHSLGTRWGAEGLQISTGQGLGGRQAGAISSNKAGSADSLI